jgi:hypothetical protein
MYIIYMIAFTRFLSLSIESPRLSCRCDTARVVISQHYLSYFSTSFNENIEPGDFFWPEGNLELGFTKPYVLPIQSPQIFKEHLNQTIIASHTTEIIGDLGITTAILPPSTTITNPAFKTKAGQKVEILLITFGAKTKELPIAVIGFDQIKNFKQPLANLAFTISDSTLLLKKVKEFMDM